MCGISECSVWGQQDPAKVSFLACRVEQVSDQPVQGRGLQTPHLVGSVLDKSAARVLFTGGWGGQGLPTQSDPIHNAILEFFTPFLHWILGSDKCGFFFNDYLFIYFWIGVSQRKEWASKVPDWVMEFIARIVFGPITTYIVLLHCLA